MKAFLTLVIILSFKLVVAQPGGGGMMGGGGMRGGGQGGQQTQERQEIPDFDAAKVAGIFNYDDTEVLKKIKLKKKEANLILEVRKAINTYNVRVNEIALLNKDNFDTLNVYVNAVRESQKSNRGQNQSTNRNSEQNREDDPMFKVMELAKEKIEPVKALVLEEEEKLNQQMLTLLDDKKYNKWLDYQEEIKEALIPQRPERNDSGMQGGGGQGGSGGGGMMRGGF
ncbi:hypothetical protein [Neotamlana laminarinivorans]|uniref:DUF4168 domain-containing protein n=1 Tax=Neotamlana laminarinivorans TaxID=2883124 RepID=A0A9X1HXG2_9FLAO|nr:hypothetical protein [Tamlana laminarinivorans]MCB4797566.1 hypothetical protein [Tamlana laminarinivorans]